MQESREDLPSYERLLIGTKARRKAGRLFSITAVLLNHFKVAMSLAQPWLMELILEYGLFLESKNQDTPYRNAFRN
jgi:hypothetical protein